MSDLIAGVERRDHVQVSVPLRGVAELVLDREGLRGVTSTRQFETTDAGLGGEEDRANEWATNQQVAKNVPLSD